MDWRKRKKNGVAARCSTNQRYQKRRNEDEAGGGRYGVIRSELTGSPSAPRMLEPTCCEQCTVSCGEVELLQINQSNVYDHQRVPSPILIREEERKIWTAPAARPTAPRCPAEEGHFRAATSRGAVGHPPSHHLPAQARLPDVLDACRRHTPDAEHQSDGVSLAEMKSAVPLAVWGEEYTAVAIVFHTPPPRPGCGSPPC